jgi:hypothetical protein
LLCGDATKRLGPNNAPAILLTHPYFLSTGICYDDLYNQSIAPPCIPSPYVGTDMDTLPYIDEYQGDQDRFNDF